MATELHPPAAEPVDYAKAEGLDVAPATTMPGLEPEREKREWTLVAVGLTALVAVLAMVIGVFSFASGGDAGHDDHATTVAAPAAAAPVAAAAGTTEAPTLKDAKGVAFEKFERVDPALPAPVTKVEVDVFHHVTQVSADLAPTEVWSYKVNGKAYKGTGVSAPVVVEQGTTVDFKLTNGTSKAMKVDLPHSLDYHSAEVNPGTRYADLAPGKSMSYKFEAKHAGVFMYHCATQPVLMHTGAGMVGMMVVKPKNLAPVDRELWITQQEYYIGQPGKDASMAKMEANDPDVIAFNGYANQYKDHPIAVKRGERIRMYVLNAGPSVWSAFHVIGTVFDRTVIEGQVGKSSQTVNLAPSQGGWVEFTLDEEGTYPFVNHSFGNMVKGSLGVLATENPPKGAGHSH
jgi:nitrite reductase (NO-forming)